MFDANIEKIHQDEETVTYRISWYANGVHHEKWITKNIDEIEDEHPP